MTRQEDDVVLKVLHTADWHLGRRFQSFEEEDRKRLQRARIEAADRLLCLANGQAVDAVLCAGDIFEEPDPPAEVVSALLEVLRKRSWTRPIFLLPGNHDPLTPTSVYREDGPLRRGLPAHVRVIDRDDFSCALGPEAVLYAVPCRSQSGQDDPTARIPPRAEGDERIRIGMVHGQTFQFEGFQTNFPIARDAARRCGLDYLAIGDTHGYRNVAEDGPPMIYPSAPEPTTFAETEAGFAALVLFPRRPRRPTVRKEEVAYWKWRKRTCHSLDDVRELAGEPDLARTVLRLVLDLKATVPELEELEQLLVELKGSSVSHGRVGVLRIDRQRVETDTSSVEEAMAELPDVLKRTVGRLKAAEVERGPEAKRALQHLYRLVRELR